MVKSEESRAKFVPGDRVWRSSSDQIGIVASEELSASIMVRLRDGDTEWWHVDDTEQV